MGSVQRLKTVAIMTLILTSLVFGVPQLMFPVKADQGSAKVYILKLNGVGAWWVDDQSDAVEGAIKACTPSERHDNIPRAHAECGATPPYYNISYQVITDWSDYAHIILNDVGKIILNTHGEILPVPNGYDEWEWVNATADAMTSRRLTWAHMAGYPFYYVWHQGDTERSLFGGLDGRDGLEALMSHIGLYDVELPVDTLPNYTTDLADCARQNLHVPSWNFETVMKVQLKRPLPKSVFKDYIALPIYEIGPIGEESEIYWEGAVISFAEPGERFDPEESHGFGGFVHLGTNQTYTYSDEATNKDIWRAYVATAAAIWSETARFEDATDFVEGEGTFGTVYTGLRVAPMITDYWFVSTTNELVVRIVFGVYGALKADEWDYQHTIWDGSGYPIDVQVNGPPGDWQFKADLDVSRNAKNWEHTITNLWIDDAELIGSSLMWVATALWTEASPLFWGLGGLILFSDWVQRLTGRYGPYHSGVTERDTAVQFSYSPEIKYTWPGDGYRYEEFQSLIAVDLYVPKGEITDWRVIPLDFAVHVNTGDYVDAVVGPAGISVAVWLDDSDEVSVFFEDFEDGMNDWSAEDGNPSAGLDHWGTSDITRTQTAWCAQVGNNSLNGEMPNTEVPPYGAYDKGMDAWLMHDVDLRPYRWANLSYYVDYYIRAGDCLELYYAVGDDWVHLNKTYAGLDFFWDSVLVPTNAEKIGFRFYSNDDSDIWTGAFLDNIKIRGKLHNDAPYSGTDAGNTFSSPNSITVSESWTNYAGYLGAVDDIQDWYSFTVGSGKAIEVELTSPPEADFNIELYDKYQDMKAGPADSIRYILSPSDPADGWRIKIYTVSGSGQYDFDIAVPSTLTVLAEDQYGDPITSADVYIDSEWVGYTGSTFIAHAGMHTVEVDSTFEQGNYKYTFQHWEDNSTSNPRNVNITSDTTIKAYYQKVYEHPGGCPYVLTWNGTHYVIDNNLLPNSETNNGTDVEDYYKLEQTLAPIYKGRWFSWYSLMLSEFENEHSYIDKVRLYAVDHNSDVNVAVTPYGEILTYSNPMSPISAVDNNGINILPLLDSVDADYYQGYNGSHVTITFASTDISNGAKLVIRHDWPPVFEKCPVYVQVLNTTEHWNTVALFYTRTYWATDIINMIDHLPDAEGNLKVRLCFVSNVKIDYVGIDTTPQADITIIQTIAVQAIHSTHDDVTLKLLLNDQIYAELLPNEQIELKFILPNNTKEARTYIIYIEGHYETIQ